MWHLGNLKPWTTLTFSHSVHIRFQTQFLWGRKRDANSPLSNFISISFCSQSIRWLLPHYTNNFRADSLKAQHSAFGIQPQKTKGWLNLAFKEGREFRKMLISCLHTKGHSTPLELTVEKGGLVSGLEPEHSLYIQEWIWHSMAKPKFGNHWDSECEGTL
jgi:hypothetical protein